MILNRTPWWPWQRVTQIGKFGVFKREPGCLLNCPSPSCTRKPTSLLARTPHCGTALTFAQERKRWSLEKENKGNYSRMCFHPPHATLHCASEVKHDRLTRELRRLWDLPLDNRSISNSLDLLDQLVLCADNILLIIL